MINQYTWLAAAIKSLKGASINYKPEWDAHLFLICEKSFALLGQNNVGQNIITLKGEPEHNLSLVEMYSCVTPGYYANKRHWFSILLDDSDCLSQETIISLLQQSYQLVLNKLPKKVRETVNQ